MKICWLRQKNVMLRQTEKQRIKKKTLKKKGDLKMDRYKSFSIKIKV